jgi:N-methylhydantoinase A
LRPVVSVDVLRRELRPEFARIERSGVQDIEREGFSAARIRAERFLDMRYVGQAYELMVPEVGDFVRSFHREHELRYGYSDAQRAIEVVNIRLRVIGVTPPIAWPRRRLGKIDPRAAVTTQRRVYFAGKAYYTPVYARNKLQPGNRLRGPAIISEYSATTVVSPGWTARVDEFENMILSGSRLSTRGK